MGRLGDTPRGGDAGGAGPQRTGRRLRGEGGVQAPLTVAQARFSPLCLSEEVTVTRDLSKSLGTVALLAGDWTPKPFGKASSCS